MLKHALCRFLLSGIVCTALCIKLPSYVPAADTADTPSSTQETLEEEGMILAPDAPDTDNASIFSTLSTEEIDWNPEWEYASFSVIHTSPVTLYRSPSPNGITVCLNAGHGTSGGSAVQTLCHPDGSAKVTGGSTSAGATYATAISEGTTMLDGTTEAYVNLKLALITKDKLLDAGYHVLMIRETADTQLDNIARTVIANQNADCHLALHYDSTENDKGFFYISVPDVASYRSMEPVASHWQEHLSLGECILSGMREMGYNIYGSGAMAIDLTQTSYSTIPSVDLECGDRASDYSDALQEKLADGIVKGLDQFFDISLSESSESEDSSELS